MIPKRGISFMLCLALSYSGAAFGFTFNRATGKDEMIFIAPEKEKKIGASLSKKVLKTFETGDPLLQKRVEHIGARLACWSNRKDITYSFYVIKGKEKETYNAFALPGGYIFIFEELVEKLATDDKIASILAHEIGHIDAKHSVKLAQTAMGMSAVMVLASGLAKDQKTVVEAFDATDQLMFSYSREAEIEADALSIQYLEKAGFAKEAAIEALLLFQDMRKSGPIRDYIFNRTHPYLSERISRVKSDIEGGMNFDSYMNLPEKKDFF